MTDALTSSAQIRAELEAATDEWRGKPAAEVHAAINAVLNDPAVAPMSAIAVVRPMVLALPVKDPVRAKLTAYYKAAIALTGVLPQA